jgi:two-component system, cell cycle sensor histidine kinase and response regulator CckA
MNRLAPNVRPGGILWQCYALAALALSLVYFLIDSHPELQSVIYQLFIFAAPVAIVVGLRRYRPEARRHWLLFAGGLVLWGFGDLYWDSYVWILGKQAPYPSVADFAYLAAYPLFLAGMLVLVRGWGRPRIGNVLDAAIVALAAGILSTLFLLTPLVTISGPLFAKSIAVAFPVMDFLMLAALMQLMFRRRKANFALRAIMVGTAAVVVSDSAYSYLGLTGAYTIGGVVDAGWLACYALWGVAALHPSMARIQSIPEQETDGLSIWRVGALLLALLAAPTVMIAQTLTGHTIKTGMIGVVIVGSMLLVATRVWLLQLDAKKSQAELAGSNERLHLAHQVASVSTWDMNLVTGRLTLSDELATLIAGSGDAQAAAEGWAAFIHPDDRERVMANFEQVRERGGDLEAEYRFISPSGREGWMFTRGRILMKNGVAARAVGVAVDVTERHASEERLEKSKEGFRMAEEAANVGTWDMDLKTGKLAWSDSLRRLMGAAPDLEATYETFLEWVHPDDRGRFDQTIKESLEGGTEFEIQYRICRGGVEGWMESRGRGLTDANGRPVRSVGVTLDISKRHAMQELLARSEEGMRLAQELGGVGTWDTDLKTHETTWSENLRRLSGVGDDVDAGRESFVALVHPDDRAEFRGAMKMAVDEGGGHLDLEFRLVRPSDGELRWMLARGDTVTDAAGSSLRFVGFLLDITERHAAEDHQAKLEQQLRQAHKLEAVGRLAGGIAHDFNNILLAIRGNGELALDALKQGENALEEVEEMVEAADRAATLTAQLLAFSRRQVLQAEVLDLTEVVGDMDKLLRRMIGEDVELHAVVSDEPVRVSADRSQVEQVIANLAVNGRDAMPDGGVLTLEVTTALIGAEEQIDLAPGRYAMLAVSDTGRGMDSETAAQIFEPFFTTKDEGTGFGLSTVHGIVVQSGGSIWVYSEVDHGTTFKIFLPLAEQAAAGEAKTPKQVASITTSTGETILLVEDDPHVQRIVGNMLRRSGYQVLTAAGAEEALALAQGDHDTIHLLLSDLIMPGTSGRELAEQIQALLPGISVLYMSGYTDDAVIRRGVLEAGMAFIQKPFGGEDLRRRVREVLDEHGRREAA